MRILLVCSEFPPTLSGYARIAQQLMQGFRAHGHDVEVLTGGQGCGRIARIAYLTSYGRSRIRDAWDIIQIVGPTPFFTEATVRASTRNGSPIVYTVNALPGLATYFRFPGVTAVDSLYEHSVLRGALARASHLVFNTEEFARYFGTMGRPYSVIPYGISECDLAQDEQGHLAWQEPPPREPGRFRVLFVGQLRAYKGIETLIAAIALLQKDAGVRFTLSIVGAGPDAGRLRGIVERHRLTEVVRLLGGTDHEELHRIYRIHDALVLPSKRGESFGIVLVEARAHGLVPISSELPGVGDLARRLGGTSFPVGDAVSLADRLREHAGRSTPSVSSLSPKGFLWRTIAAEYISLYKQLVSVNRE